MPDDTQATPTVTSLRDIFQWPRFYLDKLNDVNITDSDVASKFAEIGTWSDAFAGVSADVVAINMIDAELLRRQHWVADNTPRLQHCWAIEWDTECTFEQQLLPHGGPGCIFGNILDFASPQLRTDIQRLVASGGELSDYVQHCSKPGAVTHEAHCKRHNTKCTAHRTGGHCSSCPCTDFTCWGAQRKLSGPTMPFLAIWMHLVMSLGMPFIILENVPQFPVAILHQYMIALYWITDVVTDNVFFGHVVKRTRRYIFVSRKNVCELTRPLADVNTLFARKPAPGVSFDMLFCARDGELDCELSWAQARDSTCRRATLAPEPTSNTLCPTMCVLD